MEALTWTGSVAFLNPILIVAVGLLAISVAAWVATSLFTAGARPVTGADGPITLAGNPTAIVGLGVRMAFVATSAVILAYIVLGLAMGTSAGIVGGISQQFTPVWISLVALFALSLGFKRKLGLYGKLFDSPIGMIGFGIVMFWVFTAIFASLDMIATHDALSQVSGMKNKVPGTPLRGASEGD